MREVREETGLEVHARAAGRAGADPRGDRVVYDVVDLACTLDRAATSAPVAGDDAADVRFADAATLAGLTCTPSLVETLRELGRPARLTAP